MTNNHHMLKAGLWMALLNGILLNLLSYHYLSVTPPCQSLGEAVYLYAFSISHFFFLALIPFLLVLVPITLLCSKHTQRACMVGGSVAYALFLIGMVLDSYIYYLYRFHFNSTIVEQMVGPGATQVFELSAEMFIGAFLIIALIFLSQVFLFKLGKKMARRVRYRYQMRVPMALFVVYAGCQLTHAVAAAQGNRSITRCDRYFPICKPLNVNSQLNKLGMDTPLKFRFNFSGHSYNYPKQPIHGNGGGKNIVVVTLDSWRLSSLDSLNCPNIYAFSRLCSRFNHHYSGGNCTRNGVFSMFYGLPGVYWYDFMDQQIPPVLVEEMVKNGYDLCLYPSASMQNPAFYKNVFTLAADQCGPAQGAKAWERDRNLVQNFIAGLEQKKSTNPFFALLFFDSLHSMILPDSTEFQAPFQPTWQSPKYLEVGNSTDPTPFYNLYRNMLRYIDLQFADMLAAMKAHGLLENTIIIITGDHGQEFNENGKNFWGHNGNFSAEQVQVPFLYYSPSREPVEYTHWTSHFDLPCTLMEDVLGVKNAPGDYTIGRNMFRTDLSERTFMVCDGYNGIAITDRETGTITDLFYDGDYQIADRHLNVLLDADLNKARVDEVLKRITSFYR